MNNWKSEITKKFDAELAEKIKAALATDTLRAGTDPEFAQALLDSFEWKGTFSRLQRHHAEKVVGDHNA